MEVPDGLSDLRSPLSSGFVVKLTKTTNDHEARRCSEASAGEKSDLESVMVVGNNRVYF
jgi:hypothetical protein